MQNVAPPNFIAAVDGLRRAQPDLPNRSEAIRRLVDVALTDMPVPAKAPKLAGAKPRTAAGTAR